MMIRRAMLRVFMLLLCIALSAAPNFAIANDKTSVRRIGLTQINKQLMASFTFRDAFPQSIQKQLNSGLKTSILVQISLEIQHSNNPISYWARTIEVTYDLWEEKYHVVREDPSGRSRAIATTKELAIKLASELNNTHIANVKSLPLNVYRLRVKIETNPVSKEMLKKIRYWLARSQGKGGTGSAPSNYFGSFVGSLVDARIGKADHSIEFVSQWFKLGEQ